MDLILAVIFFLLGASLGSFAHCVASRTLNGESWLKNPSSCHFCRKKIKWSQNIPVFSWLVLRGHSACCQSKIPANYFWVESISALVVLFLFLRFELTLTLVFSLLIWVFVLVLGLTDLWSKQLPARWLWWLVVPSLGLAYVSGLTLLSVIFGGLSVAVIFFVIWLVSRGSWLGEGDIYLGAALGLSLGWPLGLLVLVFAYWLGALVASPLVLIKKLGRKTLLPFGPFIIGAWLIVLLFQPYFGRWLILLFGYWRI